MDCTSTYIHIHYKKAQVFKLTTPSPHKSALCSFFLHSEPLSTTLVTRGNCFGFLGFFLLIFLLLLVFCGFFCWWFFFSDSILEILDSLFEGVYEILEVEFMSAML